MDTLDEREVKGQEAYFDALIDRYKHKPVEWTVHYDCEDTVRGQIERIGGRIISTRYKGNVVTFTLRWPGVSAP